MRSSAARTHRRRLSTLGPRPHRTCVGLLPPRPLCTKLPRRKVHSPGPFSSSSSSSVEAVVSTWIVIPKFSLSHVRTATYIASPSWVSAPSKCSKRSKPVVSDTPASIPASSSFASCINLSSPRVSTTSLVLHVPSALFTAPLRDGSYFHPALRPRSATPYIGSATSGIHRDAEKGSTC